MSGTAVIEYQLKSYSAPPLNDDAWTWNIEAQITHAAGVIVSRGKLFLAEIRQELEEAGLKLAGEAKPCQKYSDGRFLPTWREVWRTPERAQSQLSPRAQKAQRESAARTRLYQSRMEDKMGKYDHQVKDLATRASQQHPDLGERPEKAAELVRHGHVIHKSGSRFTVTSQDGNREYFVDTEARTCTCRDYKWAPTVCKAPMCKHRLAALMVIKLDAHTSLAQPQAQGARTAIAAAKAGVAILI